MVTVVILTIGLFIMLGGLTNWIWKAEVRARSRRAGPSRPAGPGTSAASRSSKQDVGILLVTLRHVGGLWALFQLTKLGLALRASALNPTASRLVGIRVGWMLALGWGLAAAIGAVAGLFTRRGLASARAEHDAADPDLRLRRGGHRWARSRSAR